MKKRTAATAAALGLLATAIGGGAVSAGSTPLTARAGQPTASSAAALGNHCRQPGPYQLPHGSEVVRLHPRDFTSRVDHPYWPMRPGTVWHFVETNDTETQQVTVRVTHQTKLIKGIRARVVRDIVRSHGQIVEDTHDWYAQDSGGSVWYLGEATTEYENGQVVSHEGSWRHGLHGAQGGIILPARPRAGCSYREEYLAGEAQDRALILSRREAIKTPTGFHRRVLHTANSTPLKRNVLENKFYARGIGPVLEIDVSPSFARAELVSITRP
jgi:hypothetical protein